MTIILAALPSSAFAFGNDKWTASTLKDRVEDRRDNLEERREQFKENLNEKKEMFAEKQQEVRENVARRHSARLSRRFGFYYEKFSKLIAKVTKRFEKLSSEGKDMTAPLAKLAEAKTVLEEAKVLADKAVSGFDAINAEEYQAQRDQALAARDFAQSAREKFKSVLALIRESVKLAKAV